MANDTSNQADVPCAVGAQQAVDDCIGRLRERPAALAVALGGRGLAVSIELPGLSRRLVVTPDGHVVRPVPARAGTDVVVRGTAGEVFAALAGEGASVERAARLGVVRVPGPPERLPPLDRLFRLVSEVVREAGDSVRA